MIDVITNSITSNEKTQMAICSVGSKQTNVTVITITFQNNSIHKIKVI